MRNKKPFIHWVVVSHGLQFVIEEAGCWHQETMAEVHCDKPLFVSQLSFDSSEVKMLPTAPKGRKMKTNEGVELMAAHGHLLTCPDEKLLPKSIDCFGTNEMAATLPVRQNGSCAWPHLMQTPFR